MMPILAVSGVNTRVKVHQILLPQWEAAGAIGLGTTEEYSVLLFHQPVG